MSISGFISRKYYLRSIKVISLFFTMISLFLIFPIILGVDFSIDLDNIILKSINERFNEIWPKTIQTLSNLSLINLVGTGFGWIGTASKNTSFYSPADNFFVYIISIYGVFTIFYFLFFIYALKSKKYELVYIIFIISLIGMTLNVVELQAMQLLFGYLLYQYSSNKGLFYAQSQ